MNNVSRFCEELSRLNTHGEQVRVAVRGHGGRQSNLLEACVSGRPTVFLYVKESNAEPEHGGFWGLTKNQVRRLNASGNRWFVVLLLRSGCAGYILTQNEVADCIANGSFELGSDGDYKVNEAVDLRRQQSFRSVAELWSRVQ